MFTFNRKVDDYVPHPAGNCYAKAIPEAGREAIGWALDNVRVLPRFASNAFQLRLPEAGTKVASFGINTTIGLLRLFDPADKWFGLREHPDEFGLTLRYYGAARWSIPHTSILRSFDGGRYLWASCRRRDGSIELLRTVVSIDGGEGRSDHRRGGELSFAAS